MKIMFLPGFTKREKKEFILSFLIVIGISALCAYAAMVLIP